MMRPPLVAFIVAVMALSLSAADDAFRYSVRTVTEGFSQPMGFEIAPDGEIYIIELEGAVTRIDPQSGDRTQLSKLVVYSKDENGLLGIALDPDFKTNNFLYLLYSPEDFVGQRISRFTVVDNQLQNEKTVIEWGTQRRECCHHGGMLQFGPDRLLFATAGDNTHPFGDSASYAPIDRRKDREPWNAEKSSANTNDLRGGIIRIKVDLDGGYAIPEGNLFPPGTPQTRPEIYIMGCRNPWKMSIDPQTGYIYWGEVGPDARSEGPKGPVGYDEINQAREAGFYGWPYFIANNKPYAFVDFETGKVGAKFDPEAPVNDSPLNTGLKNLPLPKPAFFYWPYANSTEWPILGKGGRTACAGPVFRYQDSFEETNGFPKHFDNCLLFWDWQRPFVKWARLTPSQDLEGIEDFPFTIPLRRPSDARFAKDGTLWFLDYGSTWKANKDAKLIQVSYLRGNVPPSVVLKVDKEYGSLPLNLKLDASASKDPEGSPLSYAWSMGGEVISTKVKDTITLTEAGDVDILLTVTDESGASVTSSPHRVVVGNSPPQLAFEQPLDGAFYTPGQELSYKLDVVDAEQPDTKVIDSATIVSLALKQEANKGLIAMQASDCFNCHNATEKLVGPSFTEIAKHYQGKAGAAEQSVSRIIKGSSEVWGTTPMLAHPHLNTEDVAQMVEWIYSLANTSAPQTARGTTGQFIIPANTTESLELSASLTDGGMGNASVLTGTTSIRLNPATIQAEAADKIQACRILDDPTAQGGRYIGFIKHGSAFTLKQLRLTGQKSVTITYSSAQHGGTATLRDNRQRILAAVALEPTGGWSDWKTATIELENIADELVDIHVTITSPQKQANILNIDSIRFNP